MPVNTKKRRIKRNGYSYPVNQSGFVRRLAVSSDFHLILSACSIKSIAVYSVVYAALSALALTPRMNESSPTFHAAKISEIYGVFFFAFLAINHFVAGDV